jgi:hypothetical protein
LPVRPVVLPMSGHATWDDLAAWWLSRFKVSTRPETTLASYDMSGDALERHASHQVAGFLAGWAG